jgi:hypothetical protein
VNASQLRAEGEGSHGYGSLLCLETRDVGCPLGLRTLADAGERAAPD